MSLTGDARSVGVASALSPAQVAAAFAAAAEGSASPEQVAVRDAVVAALPEVLDDTDVVAALAAAVGPFAVVFDTPYEELGPLRRWVRDASAEADRSTPALNSMESAYAQIIAAENHDGPPLRLASGVNIIGLDVQCRRWLVAAIGNDTVSRIRNADDEQAARAAARRRGSVRFHWSVERTGLVPDPDDIAQRLPLPIGGRYLVGYRGSPAIVTRPKFRAALRRLAEAFPVSDLLVWHTAGDAPTLYSLRGLLSHSGGSDGEWPADVAGDAATLRDALWG
jgi:hypothetical protein